MRAAWRCASHRRLDDRVFNTEQALHLALAAEDGDFYRISGAVFVHHLCEVLLAFDALAVDGYDQISSDHDDRVAELGALIATAQAGTISEPRITTMRGP